MSRAFFKGLAVAAALGVLAGAMTACQAAQAAGNHAAEAGGAAAGGFLSMLFGVTGPIGLALAGLCGWIGGWFLTPAPHAGPAVAAGFPWDILVLGAAGFAVARAWAHWPVIMARVWALVKASTRGLLGGRTPPPAPPPTGGDQSA